MKGIIFNLLEKAVTAEHGADVWDTLLERAGADGSYTSLGSYSDAELVRLVEAASALTGRSASEILRWFGTAAMPMLHGRYPEFFDAHTDCGSFLRSLNDVIHAEVRKLYPGAEVPSFSFEAPEENRLIVVYRSRKQLCALAEGMIEGSARQFGQDVRIEHPRCTHRGDDACHLDCRFGPSSA